MARARLHFRYFWARGISIVSAFRGPGGVFTPCLLVFIEYRRPDRVFLETLGQGEARTAESGQEDAQEEAR